ncbi:MAG: HEAT repeat domain-containing protein, partial [Cyclobacteriaceae bacterium]|nr:HEAT repeat domain-containing protein [Cyclobacteriaceae bacterium]
ALFKFGNQDKVRKAFINGLSKQTDPVLQIKLIDMLVGLNEKRALPKFQEMMQSENHMKVVKQKAAQGLGKLI